MDNQTQSVLETLIMGCCLVLIFFTVSKCTIEDKKHNNERLCFKELKEIECFRDTKKE